MTRAPMANGETSEGAQIEGTVDSDSDVEAPVSKAATSRKSLGPPTTFVRALDEGQLEATTSPAAAALVARLMAAEFDMHLRDGGVVAYWGGMALLTLGQHAKHGFVVMIPRKVAEKCEGLPERAGVKGQLACYPVDDALTAVLSEKLPEIKILAEAADTRGGPMYQKFMRSNPGRSGVLPLDRQVQFPGLRTKLGGVGVESEDEKRFLLVDLRYGSGADVAKSGSAAETYYHAVSDRGALKEEIAEEYRRMLQQRADLGLNAMPVDSVQTGMPVACLIALAHCRSETVRDRLLDAASKATFPIFLCDFPGSDARIPHQRLWSRIGKGS